MSFLACTLSTKLLRKRTSPKSHEPQSFDEFVASLDDKQQMDTFKHVYSDNYRMQQQIEQFRNMLERKGMTNLEAVMNILFKPTYRARLALLISLVE